jgi:transcriptional regulator with XRE-family HTH domain
MINRINLILKAKNITARQFAEEIGIQPSGMSHIMSGRNNPSLEFVNKVVRRYPEIDANWLLLGRGEMYMTGSAGLTPGPSPKEKTGLTPDPSPKERGMDAAEPTLFSMPEATQGLEETGTVDRETQLAASLQEGEFVSETGHGSSLQEGDLVMESPHVDVETRHAASLQTGKRDLAPAESAGRRLVKILMFYDDHTFEEFRPQ